MDNAKDIIKKLCSDTGITFKDLALKAGMNSNSLHNKFQRDSITLRDFESLLSVLGYEISIDKKNERQQRK